jgi:hypothetical protein
MAGKVKHAKPQKEYAKQHGVSLRTIQRRSKAGLPLGDNELGDVIPPDDQRDPENYKGLSLDEAKRRRQIVGWLREARQLAILEREYLLAKDVREQCIGVGAVFDAELSALLNDMPGVLAGLSEPNVRTKLAARISSLKSSVKERLAHVTGS